MNLKKLATWNGTPAILPRMAVNAKRSATNEPSILSFFSLVFAWMTKNLLWTDFQSRFFYKLKRKHKLPLFLKNFFIFQTRRFSARYLQFQARSKAVLIACFHHAFYRAFGRIGRKQCHAIRSATETPSCSCVVKTCIKTHTALLNHRSKYHFYSEPTDALYT